MWNGGSRFTRQAGRVVGDQRRERKRPFLFDAPSTNTRIWYDRENERGGGQSRVSALVSRIAVGTECDCKVENGQRAATGK